MQADEVSVGAPTCPFMHTAPHEEREEGSSESTTTVSRIGQQVLQQESGLYWCLTWISHTKGWFGDLSENGTLQFFDKVMKLPSEDGYYSCKWISVAHRIGMIVFTDLAYWKPLFGKHKGEEVLGGIELQKLAMMILTSLTPLTTDLKDLHTKIKKCCMNLNFNYTMVQRSTPEIYRITQRYFHHVCPPSETPSFVNMTQIASQLVSRVNSLALFAPPGSKAYHYIKPLLFNDDGSPNAEWNKVPDAVNVLGKKVNDAMFYNPWYYLTSIKDTTIHFYEAVYDNVGDSPYESEYEKGQTTLLGAVRKMIEKSRESIKSDYEAEIFYDRPVLGQLEAMMMDTETYSEAEINAMARLILVISQRTTSAAVESCIRQLIKHPEWQEILYTEIHEALGEGPVDHEKLNSLKNLDNFIWETLRMFPPVPIQTREANEEMEFNGVKVPKGTTMIMPHFLIQRNPRYFDNPNTFDPNRFNKKGLKNEMYTFGRYPHNCAGKQLAYTATIKSALAALILSGVIVPKDMEQINRTRPVGGFTLSYSEPLWAGIVPRRKKES